MNIFCEFFFPVLVFALKIDRKLHNFLEKCDKKERKRGIEKRVKKFKKEENKGRKKKKKRKREKKRRGRERGTGF